MKNSNLLMFKYSQMESERIILRPISLNDAEDMYEYTSDEETTRFIYEPHKDLNQTENVIANYFGSVRRDCCSRCVILFN